jgi:hypothetical protein
VNVVAGTIPNIDAEREVGLRLHGGLTNIRTAHDEALQRKEPRVCRGQEIHIAIGTT